MSSLRNAQKSRQKQYKERSQLSGRQHLGLLEKHKDYVARARDFHKKQKHLKLLRKKASERNPDEFYFKMIKRKTKDGVHTIANEQSYTNEQIKLMKTQDLNYINFKSGVERMKIEKLQSELHMTDSVDKCKREHIVFVDSEREANKFNEAQKEKGSQDEAPMSKVRSKKLNQKYRELEQRRERARQLSQSRQGMELQRNLMGKGRRRKLEEDGNVVYKWKKQRKK